MAPNIYESPQSDPLSPKDYRGAMGINAVPPRTKLATILGGTISAALATWAVTVSYLAAVALVDREGITLSLLGHAVFLGFGAIIGLAVACWTIECCTSLPLKKSHRILPCVAMVIGPFLAVAALCYLSSFFFAGPRELDLLFNK